MPVKKAVAAPTAASTQLLAQLPERRTVEGTNVLQIEIRPELFKALDPSGESVTGVKSWALDLSTVSRNVRHTALFSEHTAGGLGEAVSIAAWIRPETPTGQVLHLRTREAVNGEAGVALVLIEGMLHLVYRFQFLNVEDRQDEVVRAEPAPLTPGLWHRVALTVETGRVRLHVDGSQTAELVFDAAKMNGGPSFHNGAYLSFGDWPVLGEAGSELLSFGVSGVRMWNVALSDDAIAHDQQRAGAEPDDTSVVGLGLPQPVTEPYDDGGIPSDQPALPQLSAADRRADRILGRCRNRH